MIYQHRAKISRSKGGASSGTPFHKTAFSNVGDMLLAGFGLAAGARVRRAGPHIGDEISAEREQGRPRVRHSPENREALIY